MTKKKVPKIDEGLKTAYQQAYYQVFDLPILLKIGMPQPILDQLLLENHHQGAAYITAFNPHSVALTETENISRQKLLLHIIRLKKWTYYQGHSLDPNGIWPPESAVLIIGISQEEALIIGQMFQQNAVVYHRLGAKSELLWCI